jgi:(p)ppGpp synthase/HD superfamily hydrolase
VPEVGYLPKAQRERVRAAVDVAFRAHAGQRRRSGEPFAVHPVEVAAILAHLGMDADTVVAGLLHDTVEDTPLTFGEIEAEFGEGVARIVEGETKVSKLGELAASPSKREVQALDLRSMFVAMTEDVRVIVVKLADRLHNMRTLGAMPPEKQRRIAKETLKVFAPLARVLGLYCIKEELEELGFRYSEPEARVALARRMDELAAQQEPAVLACRAALEDGLRGDPLLAAVSGRIEVAARSRGVYSIHRKLQATGSQLGHLRDVAQLEVVVDSQDPSLGPSSCYQALGVVHSLWAPLPGRMKDFVATPKANGYQSLHTTVLPLGAGEPFPLEVHIRTAEMHRLAQFGYVAEMAAAQQMSRRDEGGERSPLDPVLPQAGPPPPRGVPAVAAPDPSASSPRPLTEGELRPGGNGNGRGGGGRNGDGVAGENGRGVVPGAAVQGAIGRGLSRGVVARQVHWLHVMQDWHHEFVANLSASEWVETVVGDLLRGGVFVFTPEGDFVNLPKGSTVIDFAYHIRSEVGNEMVMAKVNGIPVHPSYEVQNAEVVEIVRSQGPVTTDAYLRHREWVRYAATRSARYRIQKFLREHEALDPTAQAHPPGPQSPAAEQTLAEGGGVTGSMGGSLEEDLLVGDPYNQGETMWLIVKSDDRFGLLSEITRVISSHSLSIRSYSGSAGGGSGVAHMNYELSGPTSNLTEMCQEITESSGVKGYSIGCNWTPDTQGPFSRRG